MTAEEYEMIECRMCNGSGQGRHLRRRKDATPPGLRATEHERLTVAHNLVVIALQNVEAADEQLEAGQLKLVLSCVQSALEEADVRLAWLRESRLATENRQKEN